MFIIYYIYYIIFIIYYIIFIILCLYTMFILHGELVICCSLANSALHKTVECKV